MTLKSKIGGKPISPNDIRLYLWRNVKHLGEVAVKFLTRLFKSEDA